MHFYRLSYPASSLSFLYLQSIGGSLAPQAGSSQLGPQFFAKIMRMEERGWTGEVFNLELLFTSNTAKLTQTPCLLLTESWLAFEVRLSPSSSCKIS